jgi:hypothetical protein
MPVFERTKTFHALEWAATVIGLADRSRAKFITSIWAPKSKEELLYHCQNVVSKQKFSEKRTTYM